MDFLKKVKEYTFECSYFQEMVGTMAFMLFSSKVGDDSALKVGAVYAILYAAFRTQFKGGKAMFNPAIVMSEVMTSDMSFGTGILYWIAQGVGAFVGYLIAGLLGTAAEAHDIAEFNFFSVLVNESIATGILVWMWLEIHGERASTWRESFYGFAPALMYFFAMSTLSAGGVVNPAKYEAKWSAADVGSDYSQLWTPAFWSKGFGTENLTYYFAPILSAFVTVLVYTWVNRK